MKADEFVRQLAATAPQRAALLKAGCPDSFIKIFLKSRTCARRKTPLSIVSVPGSEDLIDLFNRWNPGAMTIGIEFLDKPVDTARGLQIAVDEVDLVLISPVDGEIIVEKAWTRGHRLSKVAQDGNHLLDAMIVAAGFFGERAVDKISYEDFAAAQKAAHDCASAAGGERYLCFLLNILGAEE